MCSAAPIQEVEEREVPPAYEHALPIRANTGRERVPKARARLRPSG